MTKGLKLLARGHGRKALSGIIAAVILFAMIFTAGSGFFLAINQYKHTADQANAARLTSMQMASLENLSLAVGVSHNNQLWIEAYNTGGVPVTITAVSVANSTGHPVSLSTTSSKSSYLVGQPDLNVSLPLTLNVGVNTTAMSGCGAPPAPAGKGCSIGISTTAFSYGGGTVLAILLTGSGNTFSLQYPTPHSTTVKNFFVVNQYLLNQNVVDQSVVDLQNQGVVVGCYGCDVNLMAGGNILVTQITATPSPVQDGETITVVATVWNFSPFTASATNVTLRSIYTGSATVSPDISRLLFMCGSPTSIVSQGSAAFTCTFVAHAGGSSGVVSFVGDATACDLTGNTTSCTNGALVTSSTAASNPVQVGNLISFGPWQLSYYYFSYTDQQHQTKGSAAIITHTDTYVALYVQLTNTYDTPLTIVDGSYLQFVSPGTDVNEYIVENGTISYSTHTFAAYGCTDSPPAAPVDAIVGQHCITVSPGQTVSLAFAASSAGGTAWEWGSGGNPGGTSNVGCTVQIIIEYVLRVSGSYSLYAQNIPFQSVFIS